MSSEKSTNQSTDRGNNRPHCTHDSRIFDHAGRQGCCANATIKVADNSREAACAGEREIKHCGCSQPPRHNAVQPAVSFRLTEGFSCQPSACIEADEEGDERPYARPYPHSLC